MKPFAELDLSSLDEEEGMKIDIVRGLELDLTEIIEKYYSIEKGLENTKDGIKVYTEAKVSDDLYKDSKFITILYLFHKFIENPPIELWPEVMETPAIIEMIVAERDITSPLYNNRGIGRVVSYVAKIIDAYDLEPIPTTDETKPSIARIFEKHGSLYAGSPTISNRPPTKLDRDVNAKLWIDSGADDVYVNRSVSGENGSWEKLRPEDLVESKES